MDVPSVRTLTCGHRQLDLSRPQVMGILNLTPDSFSDGGQLLGVRGPDLDAVLKRADAMTTAGASVLDVGGESTRPGAMPVSMAEEIDRVVPVVAALASRFDCVISVDTSTPAVMREAAAAGAGLLNDVRALRRPGALEAARDTGLPICLMHMQGEPGTMQDEPVYGSVVADVGDFLVGRAAACRDAGIDAGRILFDPGFGFGKTLAHNLQLLSGLDRLVELGYPVLVGLSRKSMIGALTGQPVGQRQAGGLAAAALAVYKGAWLVRTHDVASTLDAVRVAIACRNPATQPVV